MARNQKAHVGWVESPRPTMNACVTTVGLRRLDPPYGLLHAITPVDSEFQEAPAARRDNRDKLTSRANPPTFYRCERGDRQRPSLRALNPGRDQHIVARARQFVGQLRDRIRRV